MRSFSWECPYCNQNATITESNYSCNDHFSGKKTKDGPVAIKTTLVSCPNEECKEYTISAQVFRTVSGTMGKSTNGEPIHTWKIKPQSSSKKFPDYVPQPIREDYEEACLICNLSPKASATLARRCLQGMIRDFFGISKSRLVDEIKELKDKVNPETWEAIDSVRNIGNIGAHMEKDINIIIDVESHEAELLIALIEDLISDWYVAKHERETRLKKINSIAKEKKQQKNNQKPAKK